MKNCLILYSLLLLSLCAAAQKNTEFKNLNNLLGVYVEAGEYEKAIPIAEKAILIAQKEFGEAHPDYAMSLNNLAEVYRNLGQYEKAESLYIRSKTILKKTLGENHLNYAMSLNNLALLYSGMGEYKKAEPLYIQSKEIRKKLLGEKTPQYAIALNNLAELYRNLGEYKRAEPLFIQARDIRKKVLGETHPDYASSLDNLASLYLEMGQYEKAENLFLQSREIRKKALGETHPDYTTSLNNLAFFYQSMGQYEKAESLYIQSKEIRKKALSEMHPDYATSLNNLAGLYQSMGKYEKAEPLYIQSNDIRKKILGETHPDYAGSLNNLGALYESIGQYEKAESLYIQSNNILKKALGETHPDYARGLNNLAWLYVRMLEYKKAEPLSIQAKELIKKVLGEAHPDYATSLNNLAGLYESIGQYEKAEPLYLQSMEMYKNLFGEKHPNYANSLNNLAGLYESKGLYEKAESLYLQATEILKKVLGEVHPNYAGSLSNLTVLYEKTGEYKKAEPLILQNNKAILQMLLNTFSILSEKEKEEYIINNISLLETNNSFIFNYKKASPDILRNNFEQQLIFKSLILSDSRNILTSIRQNPDTAIRRLLNDWQTGKNILAKQYALPVRSRRTDIKEVEKRTENLEKELGSKSAVFRNQQNAIHISMKDVQRGLQQDEAVIEFVSFQLYNKKWTDSTIYAAYILHKNDSVPVFIPLCEEKQLQRLLDSAGKTATSMVSNFYRGLEVKDKKAALLGKELYKLVWQPLELYLKGVKKIAYSPAGKLYGIAFHALPVDSTTVLMDKYQLQQYTNTRQVALQTLEEQSIKPTSITLFGNASFTMDSLQLVKQKANQQENKIVFTSIYTPQKRGSGNGVWVDLPGTAEEVNKIKQLFDENKVSTKSFTQTTASEENLKTFSGNSPQILHIATHGFFLPEPDKKRKENSFNNENTYTLAEDPLLRSGLILAGGNYAWSGKTPIDGIEDGIATAYEISQLNLSNTELVVLSACETALGDVKGSEGVFGLQRAFKMAGVKKMIVSLWQVPDKETAELMTTFYTYWMKGKTIKDAFAQAQNDMRKKYPPFYWAAFVLVE